MYTLEDCSVLVVVVEALLPGGDGEVDGRRGSGVRCRRSHALLPVYRRARRTLLWPAPSQVAVPRAPSVLHAHGTTQSRSRRPPLSGLGLGLGTRVSLPLSRLRPCLVPNFFAK